MKNPTPKIVTVIQRVLLHYRKPFFELLRKEMAHRGMELRLIYGQYAERERAKGDEVDISWGRKIRNRYLGRKEKAPVYQPCLISALRSDLIVVEQAARLALNYLLQISCPVAGVRLVFWGHGKNLNEERSGSFGERVKPRNHLGIDRWFAYTDLSAAAMEAAGIPGDRITTLNNSVDTGELRELSGSITEEQSREVRTCLGLGHGPVGIFCGSLYKEKRIDFLIEAAQRIRSRIPDFHLLVAGNGPESDTMERAAGSCSFIHFAGPAYGIEKALLFAVGDVTLNPGAVGLGILDSFVFRVPTVTTQSGHHGPEIAYLENGTNGFVAEDTIDAYVSCVVALLKDPGRLTIAKDACRESAGKYTLTNMVARFLEGVELALGKQRIRA
jgi:glycosyltransferase involved in cell wall biosynthesis